MTCVVSSGKQTTTMAGFDLMLTVAGCRDYCRSNGGDWPTPKPGSRKSSVDAVRANAVSTDVGGKAWSAWPTHAQEAPLVILINLVAMGAATLGVVPLRHPSETTPCSQPPLTGAHTKYICRRCESIFSRMFCFPNSLEAKLCDWLIPLALVSYQLFSLGLKCS